MQELKNMQGVYLTVSAVDGNKLLRAADPELIRSSNDVRDCFFAGYLL